MKNVSNQKAVILLSGGMDSLVTTAIAVESGLQPCALHLNYGQRTEAREHLSFKDICNYYNIKERMVVNISYLTQIGGSSLTDFGIEVSKADLNSKEIPTSYVPFRNANMLSIAVSWSEVIQAKFIFIGAVQDDAVGYPDCRKSFYDVFNLLIKEGTKTPTTIITPIIHLRKADIVKKGMELNVPFQLSWSCYKSEDEACGECDSCAFRLRGFREAHVKDPIPYKKSN